MCLSAQRETDTTWVAGTGRKLEDSPLVPGFAEMGSGVRSKSCPADITMAKLAMWPGWPGFANGVGGLSPPECCCMAKLQQCIFPIIGILFLYPKVDFLKKDSCFTRMQLEF